MRGLFPALAAERRDCATLETLPRKSFVCVGQGGGGDGEVVASGQKSSREAAEGGAEEEEEEQEEHSGSLHCCLSALAARLDHWSCVQASLPAVGAE